MLNRPVLSKMRPKNEKNSIQCVLIGGKVEKGASGFGICSPKGQKPEE